VVLSIVSILNHQTCLTETLVAELEDREIDWMLRKRRQVKRKAVLCTICYVTLVPICMWVLFSRCFAGYSALCAEIITDNRHFWRMCLIPRGSKKRPILLKWQRYRLFLSLQVRKSFLCRNGKHCRCFCRNLISPSRWNECGIPWK